MNKREADERGGRTGVVDEHEVSERHAHHEGHDDAGVADRHRGRRLVPRVRQVQLHADREHEEADADLAEQAQGAHRVGREHEREGARATPSQIAKGRAECPRPSRRPPPARRSAAKICPITRATAMMTSNCTNR